MRRSTPQELEVVRHLGVDYKALRQHSTGADMRSHKLQIFFITLILVVSFFLTAGEQDPLHGKLV